MKKTKKEMLAEALEKLNATEDYNDVDKMQDVMDLRSEIITEVIGGQGFVGQSHDADNSEFDELHEFLEEKLVYVPAHWEVKK